MSKGYVNLQELADELGRPLADVCKVLIDNHFRIEIGTSSAWIRADDASKAIQVLRGGASGRVAPHLRTWFRRFLGPAVAEQVNHKRRTLLRGIGATAVRILVPTGAAAVGAIGGY